MGTILSGHPPSDRIFGKNFLQSHHNLLMQNITRIHKLTFIKPATLIRFEYHQFEHTNTIFLVFEISIDVFLHCVTEIIDTQVFIIDLDFYSRQLFDLEVLHDLHQAFDHCLVGDDLQIPADWLENI